MRAAGVGTVNLASLSIKRPIFVSCLVILMLAVGFLSLVKMPVDLFPDVTFPVVVVNTVYEGAAPEEIETLISKPLEEEFSTLSGLKTLSSINKEGVSTVVAEFNLNTDIKYAEQQVRDRVSSVKRQLPEDIEEPIIRRVDPADQPILILGVTGELPPAVLYDKVDKVIVPKIEQIKDVGLVQLLGGRKREIHVDLDRTKLKPYELSASTVATRIGLTGQNIPLGKFDNSQHEMVFRTLGEFKSIDEINNAVINFVGNDVAIPLGRLATVSDGLEDETSRSYVNSKAGILVNVYRQSGSNTVAVADAVSKAIGTINASLVQEPGHLKVAMVRDGAKPIRANVADVKESIIIGALLTVVVVLFFLGSFRSTIITGLALPNSLLGAFILMSLAGFTVNVMTLLALSLAVGLLIDDAIVVRENIFRHVEMGKTTVKAALEGTSEVMLAVIATTLTVIAVFGPIGFLSGVVGQFFKQFGLTVCFAMVISLFDALTIAPMMSAYFGGKTHVLEHSTKHGLMDKTLGRVLRTFDRFQNWLEQCYEKSLSTSLKVPSLAIVVAIAIFVLSLVATKGVKKTFLPTQDNGEFSISLETEAGSSLDATQALADRVDTILKNDPAIEQRILIVGNADAEANKATFYVTLVPADRRSVNTSQEKEHVRQALKSFAFARPKVADFDMSGMGQRPFTLNIRGADLDQLQKVSEEIAARLAKGHNLKDIDLSSRPGKPEFQVVLDKQRAQELGVSSSQIGQELRTQIAGNVPAVFREGGEEYDIRVRVRPDQRDLRTSFDRIYVPNLNGILIPLKAVAQGRNSQGPGEIDRQDRGRYIQISADIAPEGEGLGGAIQEARQIMSDMKLPPGVGYKFVGQGEDFQDLGKNMMVAAALGILFVYLILASLYESFITPFTIMMVLPLAICGAFFALFVTRASLDIFSMIGLIMLMGIATKNSILIVDYANHLLKEGAGLKDAILRAGRTRLRPILMTSFAIVAGMMPVAIGLNEASKQRTSMGIAIIGGVVSSTLLTLVVIPSVYYYIERLKKRFGGLTRRIVSSAPSAAELNTEI
jgi:HAE1 family hydrophobic/amphiphilic exporter-1